MTLIGALLLALATPSVLATTCSRQSTDKSAPPSFLCAANITVEHSQACTARVTERLLFPHSTGRPELRILRVLTNHTLKSILVNGVLPRTENLSEPGLLKVFLSTPRSAEPQQLTLTYFLRGALTSTCGLLSGPLGSTRLVWDAGEWTRPVDDFRITFEAYAADRIILIPKPGFTISPLGGKTATATATAGALKNGTRFVVSVLGATECSTEKCGSKGGGGIGTWIIVGIVTAAGVGLTACVGCRVCRASPDQDAEGSKVSEPENGLYDETNGSNRDAAVTGDSSLASIARSKL